MKLNISNADTERQKNMKFAEDHDIPQEEMDKVYEEIYEKLPENLTGDKREARALRKTRASFKKRINSTGTKLDGFILMRFRDNDFDAKAWEKVDNYVKENGIEKAKEQGMVDSDDKYVHTAFTTTFSTQHGKVIDKENVRGTAVAIVTNDQGKNELRWLNIGKFNVNDTIPLCREVELVIKEANSPGPLYPDRNAYFLNGVNITQPNTYYSDDDFQAYGDLIESLCGDIAFYTKDEIDDYAEDNKDNRNNFIAVPTQSVLRIGNAFDNGNVPIDLELDDEQITVWAIKNIFKDLSIEEGIQGIALLSTYINKEGVPGYQIGGFIPLG